MREIRTLRATWRGLETWCGSGPRATPARQPSTLLMSGDGRRSVGHRPQATAPILDLYEAAVVKGISVVFSDLDSLWLRMLCAVKPRSREAVRRRRRA